MASFAGACRIVEIVNESKADRDELTLFRQRGESAPGWRNKLLWGDNKYIMASLLPEFAGKINLIYIDPPFATGADFYVNIKLGDLELTKEASVIKEKAYRDTWGRGLDSYFQMMFDRLVLMRELLADNGSIYVHLDWHVGHYVKLVLDEIFGKENFRNEIVWCYGGGGAPRNYYHRKHDLLYWYTKSDKWVFNIQYRPYTEGTLQRGLTKVKGPKYKLREEGASLDDWWADITKILSPTAYENLKFPTQKPEALLERIINASSNDGDLVGDFFCGSGTTGAVAEKLGRRWIMADLSKFAIHTTRKRLLDIPDCKPFEVLNLGKYQKAKLKENGATRHIDFILEMEHELKSKSLSIALKDFVISNPEYLPEEVRENVKKFTDYIDYWAVDFNYRDDTFHNMWQSFRTRKRPILETKCSHTYEKADEYKVLVKVVDIFGNDTNKLLEIKV